MRSYVSFVSISFTFVVDDKKGFLNKYLNVREEKICLKQDY